MRARGAARRARPYPDRRSHRMVTANRTHRSTRTSGFTLVEILMVITILGVAAAIVLPQVGSRDDLRTASMARAVMADLAYVQSRSVSMQRRHYVRFDVDANTYEVLDDISGAGHVIDHPVNH